MCIVSAHLVMRGRPQRLRSLATVHGLQLAFFLVLGGSPFTQANEEQRCPNQAHEVLRQRSKKKKPERRGRYAEAAAIILAGDGRGACG